MSSDVTKRALSAGFGGGALALLAPRASADTPFSSFAFRATGAPTVRTMPDRLGDVKNVKDFGAPGDGTGDDAPAIQAAVAAGEQHLDPSGHLQHWLVDCLQRQRPPFRRPRRHLGVGRQQAGLYH